MITTEKTPFFSIIIPVHRVERFLEQCLTSIRDQSFEDFECIIINDKSPGDDFDNKDGVDPNFGSIINSQITNIEKVKQAQFIFDKIVGNDKRFIYSENEINVRQSTSKNNGLNLAKGERVIFVDGDDFLEKDYLKKAFEKISVSDESDIFYGGVNVFENGIYKEYFKSQRFVPTINNLKTLLTYPSLSPTPFNYFWKLQFLKKFDLTFEANSSWGEDTAFLLQAILKHYELFPESKSKNFVKIDNLYHYRHFSTQVTKNSDYDIKLFKRTTASVASRLSQYQKLGFDFYLLAILFVLRFRCYRLKLMTPKPLNLIFDIMGKVLTIPALILSGTKKVR
jgi:glycosyltransferase involved in cell wall biosynthesis